MTLKLSFIEEAGLTVPGEYDAEVESVEVGGYRINRKVMSTTVYWTYLVTAGEFAGERIKTDTPLEGSVVFLLHRTLTALGIRPASEWSFEYDEESGRMIDPDLVGKCVKVKVSQKDGRSRTSSM